VQDLIDVGGLPGRGVLGQFQKLGFDVPRRGCLEVGVVADLDLVVAEVSTDLRRGHGGAVILADQIQAEGTALVRPLAHPFPGVGVALRGGRIEEVGVLRNHAGLDHARDRTQPPAPGHQSGPPQDLAREGGLCVAAGLGRHQFLHQDGLQSDLLAEQGPVATDAQELAQAVDEGVLDQFAHEGAEIVDQKQLVVDQAGQDLRWHLVWGDVGGCEVVETVDLLQEAGHRRIEVGVVVHVVGHGEGERQVEGLGPFVRGQRIAVALADHEFVIDQLFQRTEEHVLLGHEQGVGQPGQSDPLGSSRHAGKQVPAGQVGWVDGALGFPGTGLCQGRPPLPSHPCLPSGRDGRTFDNRPGTPWEGSGWKMGIAGPCFAANVW